MLLVCLVVGTFGAFIVAFAAWDAYVTHRSPSWPTVDGVVRKSELYRVGEGIWYRISVEYEAGGRTYACDRLRSSGSDRKVESRAEGDALVERYPVGATVPVSVRPGDPTTATLQPGVGGPMAGTLWAGVFLIVLALLGQRERLVGLARRFRSTWRDEALNLELRRPRGWRGTMPVSETHVASFTRGPAALDLHARASNGNWLPSSATIASGRMEIVQEACRDVRLVRRSKVEKDGLPAVRLEIEATEDGRESEYATFALGHRGFSYDAIVRTRRGAPEGRSAAELLDEFLAGFRLLDPDRSAYDALPHTDARFRSDALDVGFAPSSSRWRSWPNRTRENELVVHGALHAAGCILSFTPVLLPLDDVPMDAVCRGLLMLYGIAWPSPDVRRLAAGGDPESTRRFAMTRTLGENVYEYRLHCVRWGRRAALLVLSAEPGNPALDEVFEEAAAAIEPPTNDAPALEAVDDSLGPHVVVWREVANWLRSSDRHADAERCLARLVDAVPDDRELLSSLLLSFSHRGAFAEGLETYRAYADRFPADLGLRSFEPFFLHRLERREEAIAAYETIVDEGWRDPQDLADYVTALLEADRKDEALRRVRGWTEEGLEDRFRPLLARVHRERGEREEAVRLLRAAAAAAPTDVRVQLDLVNELVHAEELDDALAVLDDLEERQPDVAELHFLRGIASSRRSWLRPALRAFERAVDLDPVNPQYRDWAESTRSQLGQGDHRLIRRPIEALPLAPDDDPPTEHPFRGEDAVCLDRLHSIRFRRGLEWVHTRRVRVRIEHARAVDAHSTFRIPFDPDQVDLYVNELRVVDAEGRTVTQGRLEDWFVRDDENEPAGSKKVAHLPAPGLAPGATLEVTWTERRTGGNERFPYRRLDLYGTDPTLRSVVDVRGDVDDVVLRTVGDVEERRSDGRLRVRAGPTPAVSIEPFTVAPFRWLPTVWIAEPRESWEAVARDCFERIEERFERDPEVEELARSLVADRTDPEEKAAILVGWVRENLTYKSIPFGPRASVPDRPATTLAARIGDCKAHAMLLLHLLRAVDVRCSLALVHTRDDGLEEAPSAWQFDHMIAWCPDLGGGRFVDTVDKGLGPRVPVPEGLAGRMALVVDVDGPGLLRVPTLAGGENALSIEREVAVVDDGALEVTEEIRITGHAASWMRDWFRRNDEDGRRAGMNATISAHAGAIELVRLDARALEPIDDPVAVSLVYRIADAWTSADGRLAGRLPAPWERQYLLPRPVARRRSPFALEFPYSIAVRTTVRGPAGHRLETDAPREAGGDSRFLRWSRHDRREPTRLTFEWALEQRPGRHEAESWPEFVAVTERALDAARPSLVSRPTA
ncbi:MAG: DUF3592 domain-containing protein [Planctomycetota bacterium JB042]